VPTSSTAGSGSVESTEKSDAGLLGTALVNLRARLAGMLDELTADDLAKWPATRRWPVARGRRRSGDAAAPRSRLHGRMSALRCPGPVLPASVIDQGEPE
jgi:hypothetical protein